MDKLTCISIIKPDLLYRIIKKMLLIIHLSPIAGICDLKRYQRGYIPKKKIENYKKILCIRKGYYDYEYFNICFLNNILSLCLKAICEGYLPRIEILNSQGINIWELFFKQPFDYVSETGKKKKIFDEKILESFPAWEDVFQNTWRFKAFSNLYRTIPVLNEDANAYADREAQELLSGKKVLGVLCRGTDYTKSKPKGHPIQPQPEEILAKTEDIYTAGNYDAVYLATEDSEYDKLFRAKFGERLLINQRHYYDAIYKNEKLSLIKDVHFDRKDDDYLKGLEYISSLLILSKCNGLVAGNCGGTQAAVFWNGGKYEDQYIFNLGLYE